MYFKNFNLEDVSTDAGKTFIRELSDLLVHLNPALIDKGKIKITCSIDNTEEYIKVYIPHKTIRILDLSIDFDEIDATVQLAHANFHFQEYREDKQRLKDVISLISKMMQTTIEVHTFYKGKKMIRIQPYFVNENGDKEPFQCSFYNHVTLINPFLKVEEVVERGSFFDI